MIVNFKISLSHMFVWEVTILLLSRISLEEKPRSIHGRYTRDVRDYQKVIPMKVSEDGEFESYFLPHYYSRFETSRKREAEEIIHYMVPINGEEHHIVLFPTRDLFSPGIVVESIGPESKTKRAADKQCHYTGYVKGKNLKAALSTCYGLAGYVQTEGGHYLIEPVKDHDPHLGLEHPHLIMKRDIHELKESTCGMKETLAEAIKRRRELETHDWTKVIKYKEEEAQDLYLEALVVLDWTFLQYHKKLDVDNYVMTVMNMAYNLFHDDSLGTLLTLSVVRIIKLEEELNEMNTKITKDGDETIEAFRKWQKEINPRDDSHPNHHDVAVLLTRIDICYEDGTCGLLGIAKLAGTCDPDMSCAVCEDNGLKLGFAITHELGHTLGMLHDTEEYDCDCKSPRGGTNVMCPAVYFDMDTWSKCSQAFIRSYITLGFGDCLLDRPVDYGYKIENILPGVMYDGLYQCHRRFPQVKRLCNEGRICERLSCRVEGSGCIMLDPAAPGTPCGENKWCYQRKCLTLGERPGAVDGGWGDWSPWSQCSRTCGSGISYSERLCNSPQPSNGGKYCVGERKRHRICNTDLCDVKAPSFRNVQCATFNNKVFPLTGKIHNFTARAAHTYNPCELYCKAHDEQYIRMLKPKVVDGTTCYRGMRDICIDGVCREVPCDFDLSSNAIEDACGICHGDGTSCEIQRGQQSFAKDRGITRILVIPRGAVNIRVEETSPSDSQFVLRNMRRQVLIHAMEFGLFDVPGSKAWAGMVRYKQEMIHIPGPITEPLAVWLVTRENVSISHSMGLPPKTPRRPQVKWDFVNWGLCSVNCGQGIQVSTPKCVELSGIVEDIHCKDLQKPSAKQRICSNNPCKASWAVGDWQDCSPKTQNECVRTRKVHCIEASGSIPGTSKIVPDTGCEDTKPINEENCNCPIRQRRNYYVNNKYTFRPLSYDNSLKFDEYNDGHIKNLFRDSKKKPIITKEDRGKTILDKNEDTEITIYLEKGAQIELPPGIPKPSPGSTKIVLKGKDALKYINILKKQAEQKKGYEVEADVFYT